MLDRLRVVMPAYPELDGLTLQRGFHDVAGGLILRCSQIDRRPVKTGEAVLLRLLDAHPDWKARVAVGLRVQFNGRVDQDPRVALEALQTAIRHLRYKKSEPALSLASTAILHNPEDSTAWYIRALAYQIAGEKEKVERDMRRSILLEREGVRYPGPRASLRLERIELLQDCHRLKLIDIRAKVLNDIEAGRPPITLVPARRK
jgi:hypothetical protein